tara:strand:+ start:790 stop:1191 length:402 start_codon:yes stop_codon:yes gene_type:complete
LAKILSLILKDSKCSIIGLTIRKNYNPVVLDIGGKVVMVYNNVLLKVKDIEDISLVGDLLREQARRSSEEPGCIRFEVYHSKSDRQQFILVEQWSNQKDLERHKTAKAFTELYLPKVIPLVDRSPHLSELIWP